MKLSEEWWKWGRLRNIYHVNDEGPREVDVEGRGSHSNNVLDIIINHSDARQDTSDIHKIANTALNTHYSPPPPLPPSHIHLVSTSRISVPSSSPLFATLPLPYWMQTEEQNRGGQAMWEGLGSYPLLCLENFLMLVLKPLWSVPEVCWLYWCQDYGWEIPRAFSYETLYM